jgi:F-type H+-transporting ATPase subunit b
MGAARRAALAAMVLVTAWSIWAWADHSPGHEPKPGVAAGTAQSASGGEPDESEGPPPINWFEFGKETPPFIAMVVNFGILAAGYYVFGRKPIAAALQNRRDSIAGEIEQAQKMKREAEARAKTYQAKLDRLEDELRTAREGLVRAGEAERDRIVADAEAKAERMREDASFLVEQELKQIRQDLWRDALDAAVTAAEQLLAQRVTSADHERLAEDYLGDLGGRPRTERVAEPMQPAASGTRSPS